MPARSHPLLPLAIAGVALALSIVLARSFPLVDPDEGRNAEVGREMAVAGDPIVPRLAGMPYLDKPPALFWAIGIATGVAGRTPWAARLPAALAGALTLWVLCDLALRHAGPGFSLRAGLLLMAAPLFAVLSAYVIFDMLLTLCVTLLWTGLADEAERGPTTRGRLVMFAAIALGILIKGPVMLAWAIGGSVGAALLMRSRVPLRWLVWIPGWVIVLGLAGTWFTLASIRYPEYPHYAFLEESLERLSSGSFHRDQPLWFVPAVLAGGALPWSLATPWRPPAGNAGHIALGFIVFAAIMFTLSHSKLVTYLLPAIPPMAWLAAEAWSDARRAARGTWLLAAVYAVLAAGLGVVLVRAGSLAAVDPGANRVIASLAMAFGVVAALTVVAGRMRPALGFSAALAFTPLVLVIGHPLLVEYAERSSGAPLARWISRMPEAKVLYDECYSPGTDFLLGRTSTLVSPLGNETTSNYQVRYREKLMARGQWTALPGLRNDVRHSGETSAEILVRSVRSPYEGKMISYRDARFVAYSTQPFGEPRTSGGSDSATPPVKGPR